MRNSLRVTGRRRVNDSAPLPDPVILLDNVDLTLGSTFEFKRAATVAVGFVTPVTGPKPFDWELLAQFNLRFGATLTRARQGGQGQVVATNTPGTHVVQPGENLFRIALRYNTTVEALATLNNITNPNLVFVGAVLRVPVSGGTATATPS